MGFTQASGRMTARMVVFVTAAMVVFAIPAVSVALPPTAPSAPTPWISDKTSDSAVEITIQWGVSVDPESNPVTYSVYRYVAPITSANLGSATLLQSGITGETYVTSAHADEIAQSFSWYYAVQAVDSTGEKALSKTAAPNPHSNRSSSSVSSCRRCHDPHTPMDYDYTEVELCYSCHGSSAATGPETDIGDKSTLNIKADFYDYASQTAIRENGSQHRSSKMIADKTECDACHTTHRSPYFWPNGTPAAYSPPSSFRKLLRVMTGPAAYSYYSQNSVASESGAFCLSCHGSATADADGSARANILSVSSDGYNATAGDHNEAGYSAAAHGPAVVMSNDYGKAGAYPAAEFAQVQCLACHDKHASRADNLIAYRGKDTLGADGDYTQAELCFACHRMTGEEAGQSPKKTAAAYLAPFAWNGRDVFAQFMTVGTQNARSSRHPMTAGGGQWVPKGNQTIFFQTSAGDFNSDTLQNTSTSAFDGSVVLDTFDQSSPIPPSPYVLVSQAASTGNTDAYLDGDAAWNEDFNPTSIGTNPGAGASSVTKNGVVFAFQGNSTVMRTYAPPNNAGTGTWGTTTAVWQSAGAGSDMVLDSSDGYIWALVGGYTPTNANGGSNIRRTTNFAGTTLAWFDTTGYDGPAFRTGGTDRRLGAGSALAWVPANGTRPERLYVVNRDGTSTRDGALYYYGDADTATGGANWTSTTHVLGSTGTASDTGSRSVYFRIGTTDYIYYLRGAANRENLIQLANTTAAAGTMLDNGTANPWNGNIGDGCSIVWNGDSTQAGFRLYATRGGNTDRSFKVASWNGTALVWTDGPLLAANSTTGTYLSYATCDPAGSAVTPTYYGSGTITGTDVSIPSARPTAWGTLTWNGAAPANTTMSVTVRYSTNDFSSFTDLPGVTSGADLNALGVPPAAKIRLISTFSTTAPLTATPRLDDWAVTASYEELETSGSVTCYNCHNTHFVATGNTDESNAANWWNLSRVSDPDNTTQNFSTTGGTVGDFCLRCHDGSPPAESTTEASMVPYAVGFRSFDSAASPFFLEKDLWNKSAAGADWGSSRHNAVGAVARDCGTCHDPHASNFDSLTAFTGGTRMRANTDASVSKEENLCYAATGCHNAAAGTRNVQTPMAGTYSHTAENAADRHVDSEGAAGLGASNRHAECADCHDPHAAAAGRHTVADSTAGGALRGAVGVKPVFGPAYSGTTGQNWTTMNSATNWLIERITGTPAVDDSDFEAYVCLKCHSNYTTQLASYTRNGQTYTPTDVALEFNPSNQSEHNVFGQRLVVEEAFNVNGTAINWPAPADGAYLVAGWTSDSQMTCTDCHTNNSVASARGPHGSSAPFMLIDNRTWSSTTTLANYSTSVCGKCHTALGNSNSVHEKHAGRGGDNACQQCHIRIPHGWKRPRLLGYTTDPAPYNTVGGGLRGIRLTNHGPTTNWSQNSDCLDGGCYGGEHASATPLWP